MLRRDTTRRGWWPWALAVEQRWLMPVLLSSFFGQAAVFAARPAITYRVIALHADAASIGLVASAFAALPLLVAIPIGGWVDRRGAKGPFLLGGTVLILDGLALVKASSVPALVLESGLLGLGHILMAVAGQGYVASRSTDNHDAAFASLTVAVSAGQLAGSAVLAVAAVRQLDGSGGTALGSSGTSSLLFVAVFAAVVSTLAIVPVPALARKARAEATASVPLGTGIRQILRSASMPQAMLASLAVLTSIDVLIVYLPLYGQQTGLSATTVGLLLTVRAAASLVSRLFTGALLAYLGRSKTLLLATLAPAIAFGLFPLAHADILKFGLMVVAGSGLGLGQPLTMAWVASRSPEQLRGTALGVRLAGNRMGQLVAPLAVGAVATAAGAGVLFLFLLLTLGGTSVAIWRAQFDRQQPPS